MPLNWRLLDSRGMGRPGWHLLHAGASTLPPGLWSGSTQAASAYLVAHYRQRSWEDHNVISCPGSGYPAGEAKRGSGAHLPLWTSLPQTPMLNHLQAAAIPTHKLPTSTRCPTSAMAMCTLGLSWRWKPHSHTPFLDMDAEAVLCEILSALPWISRFLGCVQPAAPISWWNPAHKLWPFSFVSNASVLGFQIQSPHQKGGIYMH